MYTVYCTCMVLSTLCMSSSTVFVLIGVLSADVSEACFPRSLFGETDAVGVTCQINERVLHPVLTLKHAPLFMHIT